MYESPAAGILKGQEFSFLHEGPPVQVNKIAKIMKFREEADYNVAAHFTREDYLSLRQEAAGLASAVRRIIDQSAS